MAAHLGGSRALTYNHEIFVLFPSFFPIVRAVGLDAFRLT